MSKTKKWLTNAIAYILGVGSVHTGLALSKVVKEERDFAPEDDDDIFADYDEFEEVGPEKEYMECEDLVPDDIQNFSIETIVAEGKKEIEQKPDLYDLVESYKLMKQQNDADRAAFHMSMPESPQPPYMITASEYGMKMDEDYETEHLTYHANGVLSDFQDIRVDNPVDLIGQEALSRLINCKSIYDEDAVIWVRNDKYRTDYEIEWDKDPFDDYGSFDEE